MPAVSAGDRIKDRPVRVDTDVPQGERDVVVDVGVDAQEGVLRDEPRPLDGRPEGHPPRVGDPLSVPPLERQERPPVVVGKRHGVPAHPRRVPELPGLDGLPNGRGHSPVHRQEDRPPVVGCPESLLQGFQAVVDARQRLERFCPSSTSAGSVSWPRPNAAMSPRNAR